MRLQNISPHYKQVALALIGVFVLDGIALLLLGSCLLIPCRTDLVRPRLAAILICCSILGDQLFYKKRVKGREALVLLFLLTAIAIILIGKVISWW